MIAIQFSPNLLGNNQSRQATHRLLSRALASVRRQLIFFFFFASDPGRVLESTKGDTTSARCGWTRKVFLVFVPCRLGCITRAALKCLNRECMTGKRSLGKGNPYSPPLQIPEHAAFLSSTTHSLAQPNRQIPFREESPLDGKKRRKR